MPSVTSRPGAVVEDDANYPWTNIGYSIDTDTTTAASSVVGSNFYGSCTRKLLFSSIGFSIPDNATITGVRFIISFGKSGSGTVTLYSYLLSGSTRISSRKTLSVSNSSQTTYQFGGDEDLWGASLTPSIVSSSSFGVEFQACKTANAENVYLYHTQVEIYYTIPIQTENGLVQASEERLLTARLYPTDSHLLLGNEAERIVLAGSDLSLLSAQDSSIRLSRTLPDSSPLRSGEEAGLGANLFRNDPSPLLAMEAGGLIYQVEEAEALFGVEGSLLRALLPRNESSSLAGEEDRSLSTSRTASDPSSLSVLDLSDLQALIPSLEIGGVLEEGEEAGIQIPVSELFPLLGEEGAQLLLPLEDLLSISATDLLPRLIRILDPRARIWLEGPKATIMVSKEGGELVERVYRGTEVAVVLRFSSSIGRYYDPLLVQLLVRKPSGSVSNPPVQRIGPGTYRAELRFDEPGIWVLRAEGIDPLRAVTEKRVEVIGDL
jgi:hypothetical protein